MPVLAIGSAIDFMRGKWWLVLVAALGIWLLIEKGNSRHWEKQFHACEQRIEIAKREAAEQAAAADKGVNPMYERQIRKSAFEVLRKAMRRPS